MNKSKILFIICEGTTDEVTFHRPLSNYLSSGETLIKVVTTQGDIAYTKKIDKNNCKKYVKQIVDDFKEKMFLYSTDFLGIIHFVDTDGAFMNQSHIIDGTSSSFTDSTFITASKKSVIARFTRKKEIYEELVKITSINKIPYYKFFFSRNLEHALYDLPQATLHEKITLSNMFEEKYKSDALGLEEFLQSLMNDVPNDYNESWNYIFQDDNSIKRCSNSYLLLKILKNLS